MRNYRNQQLDRALLCALAPTGNYLLAENVLRSEMRRQCGLGDVSEAELSEAIRHADEMGCVTGIPGEYSMRWRITDVGRAVKAENNF
ncbi:MAG: hypothetical protein LBG65_04360 [Puniceicoccales bacterium]|jgi:hypothetical protein|nr:hypothetical protein [Puniceicoccales bacterium]